MSLKKAIDHNQGIVLSMAVAAVIPLVFFGCHLTQAQKKHIITTAAISAEAVVEGAPLPWSQIGLAIGALFGSGTMIDNRRKDVLIKRLKTENANAIELVTKLTAPPLRNTTVIPPHNNN